MMPLSEILFLGIVLYLLYRFVFNFLIPVFRTTRQVRQQFRNMQDVMKDQQQGYGQQGFTQQTRTQQTTRETPRSGNKEGEYIDFEEIKN